uniref:Uncharacterized protein n=1 Tax=Fagus sylvatica TaxID=28930 RepID=A0A2N9G6H7_FAGSY
MRESENNKPLREKSRDENSEGKILSKETWYHETSSLHDTSVVALLTEYLRLLL